MKYLIPFLLLASPAMAEFSMTEGTHFVMSGDYDYKTDSYSVGAPEGTAEACFRITSVAPDRSEFDVVLVSGSYHPWWSDEPLQPGFVNTYVDFPDSGWRDNNPGVDWHVYMSAILKTVPSCPAKSGS